MTLTTPQALQAAADRNPGCVTTAHMLVDCLYEAGRFADAVKPACRLIALEPDEPSHRGLLVDVLRNAEGEVKCGRCEGKGKIVTTIRGAMHRTGGCPVCDGSGTASNGFAAWAEFVECQQEIAQLEIDTDSEEHRVGMCSPYCNLCPRLERLRKRERDLLGKYGKQWFGEWAVLGSSQANLSGDYTMFTPGCTIAKVENGLVSRVRCTLATWVGGECERCVERNRVTFMVDPGPCRSCGGRHGTVGRTPGIGPQVCRDWPIEAVEIVGKEPHQQVGEGAWHWAYVNDIRITNFSYLIPNEIMRCGLNHNNGVEMFPTRQAALNAAALARGRAKARESKEDGR